MNLAIIPARGGSKRVPRKNIREFCGKPIIGYPIQAALASGCFDEVMVSTDDDDIAEVALSLGAQVPFMRSADSASDVATTADVLVEVLRAYLQRGREWTYVCCLYPTASFVTPEIIQKGLSHLRGASGVNSVVSIVRYSHPIQRSLALRDGIIAPLQPEHQLTRSQDLESRYHDAGQFYWLTASAFLETQTLIGTSAVGFVLPEGQVQDIDSEEDWAVAEMKFRCMLEVGRE